MQELFLESSLFPVTLPDAEIKYYPHFYTSKEADFLYQKLNDETPWKAEKIKVFGKEYDQPRLTALHAVEQKSYTYANLTLKPLSFTPILNEILLKLKTVDDAIQCGIIEFFDTDKTVMVGTRTTKRTWSQPNNRF